jgi:sulfite reductase (NADPH) flavoprotein alpha-component
VFDWLENGAHVYVCGATSMAREVEDTLRKIIMEHGARDAEVAGEYVAGLREQHRFARDVY